MFAGPDCAPLAAAQSPGVVGPRESERLCVAQGDVACCFYKFMLPEHLREAFGLPAVPWSALPAAAPRRVGPCPAEWM
eukprot:7564922-Pyramimonas_sp.AAC.1